MKTFLQRLGAFVLGVLCGFDRIRFKGSKRKLAYADGIARFCFGNQVKFRDFVGYAKDITATLTHTLETPAKQAGVYRYLNSSLVLPGEIALEMAGPHPKPGLIAVYGRVEPCQIIVMRGKKGLLEPRIEIGKCMHYYHYYWDMDFGLRYTRLQTWFPFTMHIGINGRDWLGQQLHKAGIAHTKKDNCFTWIEDFPAAQKLADRQLKTNWTKLLEGWARQSNPLEPTLFKEGVPYYWTAPETEYATDFAFRSPEDLQRFYPAMVHQAYATLQSGDLLRFMNYRVTRSTGEPWHKVVGEIKTTLRESVQGTCVRHRVIGNLLKMYDKQGSVLRLETLLKNTLHFRVFRTPEGAADDEPKRYMRLRQGVADMHRRAEVSQKVNDRYAASLATVEEPRPLSDVIQDVTCRTRAKGRSVRALNPLAQDDAALLEAISRGEFLIHGFRNRDVRQILFGTTDQPLQRTQAAKITRLFGILRAHGLIAKVPKTHRYQLTQKGRTSISALIAARNANITKLLQAA